MGGKTGRPTKFSQKLADKICEELAVGRSLRNICFNDDDMPAIRTVFMWLRTNEGFMHQYEKAKQESTDYLAEEIQDIADDKSDDYDGEGRLNKENVQRARLRIDTRKWIMAKMKPKKYGDKLDLTTDGEKLPTPIYGGQSSGTNS